MEYCIYKKFIVLILIIFLFIWNIKIIKYDIENFTDIYPTLIWRQIYHLKYYDSNIDNFMKNKSKVIHINNKSFPRLLSQIDNINFDFKIIFDYEDFSVPFDSRNTDFTFEMFRKIYNCPF